MKLKSLILTITLSLFTLSGLLAQDKYEYATVEYPGGSIIRISTNSDVKEIAFSNGKKIAPIHQELIKKIEEMNDKGWETYNVNTQGYIITYFLRKKKN